MNSTSSTPLATLQCAGIITADQHMQALSHRGYSELAGNDSLADHLVWLRGEKIVDEAQLAQATAHVKATFTGAEQARYLAAIEGASGMLVNVEELQKACFRRVLNGGWITQAECDRALAAIGPNETVVTGPAGILAWMIDRGIIEIERLNTVRAAGNPDGDPEKAAMLADLEEMLTRPARLARRRWAWGAGTLLVAGFVAWLVFWPASVPGCATGGTRSTIERLFLESSLGRIDEMKPDEAIPRPEVGRITEVGYASASRVRACKTTVKLDGESIPYAFTIAAAPEGRSGFVITGAQPTIVEARFGHIDADGHYGNKAEPLGRAEVERAFRAGIEGSHGGLAGPAPGKPAFDVENAARRKFGLSYDSAERKREIAEVEPLGPCRPVEGDKVYRCRLLVEHNEPLLAALGRDAGMVLDGEFTFVRDGTAGQWCATEGLRGELRRASIAAAAK
ncbi:hypothetical protein ACFFTM_17035 [Pseudoduganella plicata]|uniref:Uncharacterized protein n=1 Tax=Pseudoduganella plicata TaxID=321984 RepID=A0A4P7B9Q5_9BURK|nr:hypothetical protein [Pseudoduganella plicata]QBQ35104.1 hypothetical protein E1742_02140 [Pseudoduganella plicata]GGZ10274.1 hypothetical protein GCM10007388_49730 [Pseudoduganella plicata]